MQTERDKEARRLTQYSDRDEIIMSGYGTIRYRSWLLLERARLAAKGWPCIISRNGNPRNLALFRAPVKEVSHA